MMYVFGNTKYEYNFKYPKHFCFGVKQRVKHWMCIVSVPAMYFGVNYQYIEYQNISLVLCDPLCHSKLSSQPLFALLLKESSSADWLGRKEMFCLLLELCKSGLIGSKCKWKLCLSLGASYNSE